MNTDFRLIFHKFTNILCTNNDTEKLADEIKLVFSDYYEISEINILYYDNSSDQLRNITKNFEPAEDYYSEEKIKILNDIFMQLKSSKFIINDDTSIPDNVLETDDIICKTISVALVYESKTTGFIRLRFKTKISTKQIDFKLFEVFSQILSLKIMNIYLANQLEIKSGFYKSIKDIAKLIETQYELKYIIPLVGEMIDKFIPNHLIYVFIKQDDKYTLFWPSACWSKTVYGLIDELTPEIGINISTDKKTAAFALVSEGDIIGCIVAHSTIDKLTPEELDYLSEFTKQSAITIERANTYSDILKNATTDALTGLNNRSQFEIRLKEQFAIANRQDTPLCAIMTDIDFFKKFNDTYGHAVGDKVLKTVANTIKSELREYDIASRYGGEEFCILLPQTKLEEAVVVAERLRSAVETNCLTLENEKDRINITISVGVSQLDLNDMPEDLYMKADRALYEAKEDGRNRVVVYSKK